MRRVPWLVWLVILSTWLSLASVSFAQDEADEESLDEETEATEAASDDGAEAGDDGDDGDDASAEPAPAAEADEADEPAAASGAHTWWVGPYVEMRIVPSFLLNLFLDASPTVVNPAFGATITHRDAEGFSWVLGIGYASYGFDGPFRAKGDPELDTEWLNSDLGFLHLRGQLMWSVPIGSSFAFEYGVGIELGAVLGSMVRSEAYKQLNGEFAKCQQALVPDPNYCEPTTNFSPTNAYNEEGAHYNVEEERVPPVAAALMLPALALRFTPIEQLAIKLEASFGLMQFSFGLSAAYGLGG